MLAESQAPQRAARLNPLLVVAGQRHVMVTQFAAAVHVRDFGLVVANVSVEQHEIVAALDPLITGV